MLYLKAVSFKNEINLTIKNTKHITRCDKQHHILLTLDETEYYFI